MSDIRSFRSFVRSRHFLENSLDDDTNFSACVTFRSEFVKSVALNSRIVIFFREIEFSCKIFIGNLN